MGSLLGVAKWSLDAEAWLGDFVHRHSLPHLAIVTKGQHLSIGTPKVSAPSLIPYVLLHSTHRIRNLAAQPLQLKDGRGRKFLGSKLGIPETFPGYFEILSEDGRGGACLDSVSALWRAFPELALVRGPCKAHLPDGDGELRSLSRTRNLVPGELLTLVGQFNLHSHLFLRCFDAEGHSVFLKLSARGRFSPVASSSSEALDGLHSPRSLLRKRLPLTVRLVYGGGALPPDLEKAQAAGNLVFQLMQSFTEEVVVAQSVSATKAALHAVPLSAHLKLAPARNHHSLRATSDFQRLSASCEERLPSLLDILRPCPQLPPPSAADLTPPADPKQSSQGAEGRKEVSDGEIDQLYDYIRGLAPLPESCQRPPPPPLETIPSRRPKSPARAAAAKQRLSPQRTSSAQRPRSKSTEKASLMGGGSNQRSERTRSPVRRSCERKRRPLSMVLPDHEHQQLFSPAPAPAIPPPFAPPRFYQSLANLALSEDAAAYMDMAGPPPFFHGHPRPLPPPPPLPVPLGMGARRGQPPSGVFPRFAPRYALYPPMASYPIG